MRQKNVLVTAARAPVAVHVSRMLHTANHRVFLCDHLKRPLGAMSKCQNGYLKIPSLRLAPDRAAQDLLKFIKIHEIEYVVPTCEEIFYLAKLWSENDIPAQLVAPPITLLETVHNKFRFMQLTKKMGLPVPATNLLQSKADVEPFRYASKKFVFKPVWSRFASNVLINPSREQLDRLIPTRQMPWVAQEFLLGDEVCAYAIAREGKLLALSQYRGLIRAGLGASICFEPITIPAVTKFVEAFVEGTKWTGQISFDLMLRGDGTVLPLECNPRTTSGVHFFDDATNFSQALLSGQSTAVPSVNLPQGVRLAILAYGLLGLGKQHNLRTFWYALINGQDILKIENDPIGFISQIKSIWEVVCIAHREKLSLQKASTYDLEWDGPDQSNISKCRGP